MDILQAFVLDGTSHDVSIKWENGVPLFRASDVGQVLEISNIHMSLQTFDEDEKVISKADTPGGPQEVTYLTEQGVYKLIMRSRKPIAKPFQKWVCNVIVEIRKKGFYELEEQIRGEEQQKIADAIKAEAQKYKIDVIRAKHEALIQAFRGPKRNVVYFGLIIDTKQGKKLIKIGATDDIYARAYELQKTYGDIYIIEVFDCALHFSFESFLHGHANISKFKTPFIETNGATSREVFEMSDDDLEQAFRIAKRNLYMFVNTATIHQMIEHQKNELELERTRLETIQNQATPIIQNTYIVIDNDIRAYTQARGPKIQRYSPDGSTLLETYPGCAEASRDPKLDTPVAGSIRKAIQDQAIYKGYRWAALDRELADDTFQNIGETANLPTLRKGYVAMLNLDKNKIVKVFCDQKEAAEDRKFKHVSAISSAITRGSLSSGHYFVMWYDCSPELQEEYLTRETLPNPRVRENSRVINQIHPITKEIVKTYSSTQHVIKTMRISRASLYNAIAHNIPAKGYLWTE